MTAAELLAQLEQTVDEFRFADVPALLDQINPADFDERQTKRALNLLRRKRLFRDLERAAGRFMLCGSQEPVVRRQYIQALIDQNRIAEALKILRDLPQTFLDHAKEGPELCGLTGRALKQLFVDGGEKKNLVDAIQAYLPCWVGKKGDYRWHGINVVALLDRAEKEGVDTGVPFAEEDIAKEILFEIEDLEQKATVWDYSTAMEASIALKDIPAALKWAKNYARHPDADAFELGSTLRQMKEVWSLQGTEIGKKLLPVLEYELLQRQGAQLEVTSLEIQDNSGFQAVYGSDASVPITWMDAMHERCRAIARISDVNTGVAYGTGFLMKGNCIRPELNEKIVLVTNAHVISDVKGEAPIRTGDGAAEFTRLEGRPKVQLGKILFSSPKNELDVTVLDLEAPTASTVLDTARYLPLAGKNDRPQRIYVIGHPNGADLAVTLYDNSLVGYPEDRYVHYKSPTEGGHSGSPVFTNQWKVIALHHRARAELLVNEGVLLKAINGAPVPPDAKPEPAPA